MKLIKQLIEKSIERYNESKLIDDFDFEVRLSAITLAYSWLVVKKKIKLDVQLKKKIDTLFFYYYSEMLDIAIKNSRNKQELLKNYESLKNKFKINFNKFDDEYSFYITKFLNQYEEEKDIDDDTASVFFTQDAIAILETNYPD